MQKTKWLNCNIVAMGFTSFFSDFGQEMITALLPTFIIAIGGTPALLGIIEGVADASVSFMKIVAGWYSDYSGKRKPWIAAGYLIASCGSALFALAYSWVGVFSARIITRLGKGLRNPARDALLSESVTAESYGRAFGFQRMMDTLGAISGPLLAYMLIDLVHERIIFLIASAFVFCAFLTVLFFITDLAPKIQAKRTLFADVVSLPSNFVWYLVTAGFFSLGDFAVSLRIMRATQLLTEAQGALAATSTAILLYTLYNIVYAAFSYPVGHLADSIGKKSILCTGYILAGLAALGFMFVDGNIWYLGFLFMLAGSGIAITDPMQRAVAADLLPNGKRGMGYGILSSVQGFGSLISSTMVGLLWTYISPKFGFAYAAVMCLLGAGALMFVKVK